MTDAPRVLLLDVMDTLVVDPFFHSDLRTFFGVGLRELGPRIRADHWVRFERGELDEPTYYAGFFADGTGVDGPALAQWMAERYRPVPGIEALLGELRQAGVPMYALSNYPVWWRLIERELRLSRWLQWRFVSCMTGVRKPDPAAYTGPAAALGVPTAQCVFVDDRRSNVDAAIATGMAGVVFESAAQLRRSLVDLGVLTPTR